MRGYRIKQLVWTKGNDSTEWAYSPLTGHYGIMNTNGVVMALGLGSYDSTKAAKDACQQVHEMKVRYEIEDAD